MRTDAIRIMLDHLYEVAALQGIELLTCPEYCFVCRTVEACEQGKEVSLPERTECMEDLRNISFVLGVRYEWLVHKALVDIGFYDKK